MVRRKHSQEGENLTGPGRVLCKGPGVAGGGVGSGRASDRKRVRGCSPRRQEGRTPRVRDSGVRPGWTLKNPHPVGSSLHLDSIFRPVRWGLRYFPSFSACSLPGAGRPGASHITRKCPEKDKHRDCRTDVEMKGECGILVGREAGRCCHRKGDVSIWVPNIER